MDDSDVELVRGYGEDIVQVRDGGGRAALVQSTCSKQRAVFTASPLSTTTTFSTALTGETMLRRTRRDTTYDLEGGVVRSMPPSRREVLLTALLISTASAG